MEAAASVVKPGSSPQSHSSTSPTPTNVRLVFEQSWKLNYFISKDKMTALQPYDYRWVLWCSMSENKLVPHLIGGKL